MRFRIKKTLVGIAALSLLVPVASHADVTPGKWIFDGFSRSTRDGKGSTCLGSGGETHAFDSPDCTGGSASAKAAADAAAKARNAARDQELAAAKKASAEANEFLPGGHKDFRVQRNDGIKLRDGLGRECVKNGSPVGSTTGNCADPAPQSARGVDSIIAARAAAKKEAQAASAAAAAAAKALPMVPGGALAEGQKGAYVYHPAGSSLRDGYGRSCVKDGLWHPAMATEDCHPDLYNQWQAKAAPAEPDLIKRVQMPPPEAERAAEVSAAPPAVESAPAPAPAVAAAESAPKSPIVDQSPAEFPITKYSIDGDVAEAAALPTVAALAADVENDADDEDDELIAESDETSDDSDDAPAALATPGSVDEIGAAPAAVAAADDDDVEDESNAPDEPDDDDEDAMPFLAGDMREEEDATLAMADDGAADDDDDAVLDEDDAPVAAFATEEDDNSDEEAEDLVASDDVEDDVDAVYLGDADQVADTGEASTLAMAADEDEDEDPDASDDEDEDTDTVFLGDADQVADSGEASTLAMVADEDDDEDLDASDDEDEDTDTAFLGDADQVADAGDVSTLAMIADDDDDEEDVFAADDDDDAPAAFAADEPALAAAPAVVVAAAEAPKAAVAPAAPVDNKQVEFPVTRYEVEGSTPEAAKAPEPAPAPTANAECPPTTIQMEEGRFSFDRYTLLPTVVAKLDAIAGLLKSAKCDAIMITGHTDRIGTSKYNQRLSERRAAAAKNYLVTRKGIDESLVTIAGRGEAELLTTASDCKGKRKKALIACYAPDRRVVITATARKN